VWQVAARYANGLGPRRDRLGHSCDSVAPPPPSGVRATRASSTGPLAGVLIANKVDLRQQDRGLVRREEGEEFARLNGLKYFEVSAVRTGARTLEYHCQSGLLVTRS
jgi:hypothetical protein